MGKEEKVLELFEKANIILNDFEKKNIEYADFGLNNWREEGLNLVVYANTPRYCAKEMVLLPKQTCPEHKHPPINGHNGKEETFRCRYGVVYLYICGENNENIKANIPSGKEKFYLAKEEHILKPGEQFTILPNTYHWFQAGEEGAVVSEFSSESDDKSDVFRDINIKRV